MALEVYLKLSKRILFAAFLIFITRVLFYLFNPTYFVGTSFFESLPALIYGIRFDLASAFIYNCFLIPFSFLPVKSKIYQKFLLSLYLVGNLFCLSLDIVDIEYFEFNGKRITRDIFLIGEDMLSQLGQLSVYYWYVPLAFLVFAALLKWFFKRSEIKSDTRKISYAFPIHILVYLCLSFIIVRGGLQMRSLSTKDAFIFSKHQLGNLALNSAYTFIRSLDEKEIKKINYFKSDQIAKKTLLDARSFKNNFKSYPGQNVVIIIIESLSTEYLMEGYTPFIDKLSQKALFFKYNFANGRRSIEALPSILVGVPSLFDTPLSQGKFQTNKFESLYRIFKNKNYDVSFFHGGKTGTMDFDSYTRSLGCSKYFGKEDYPNPEHDDGHWGIFDHYFYDYFLDYLNKVEKPFFSTFFSLSSHQPYTIPPKFNNKFSKGDLEIHESIQYADYALERFFKKAKKQKWFNNTLFVITADHTQKLHSKRFTKIDGKYRVPLIFYHPTIELTSKKKITQHADIMPSILDFTGLSSESKPLIGSSVFNDDFGFAIMGRLEHLMFAHGENFIVKIKDKYQVFDLKTGTEKIEDHDMTEQKKYLEAQIQYIVNGLNKNEL